MKRIIRLTEGDLINIVNVVINENKFNSTFSNYLKKLNIKTRIVYLGSRENVSGDVFVKSEIYLTRNNNPIGSSFISFKVGEDNQLMFDEHLGDIKRINSFKGFPPELIIGFFVDKIKNYIQKRIDDKTIPPFN
jgi:acyl-CoA thioesterase